MPNLAATRSVMLAESIEGCSTISFPTGEKKAAFAAHRLLTGPKRSADFPSLAERLLLTHLGVSKLPVLKKNLQVLLVLFSNLKRADDLPHQVVVLDRAGRQ